MDLRVKRAIHGVRETIRKSPTIFNAPLFRKKTVGRNDSVETERGIKRGQILLGFVLKNYDARDPRTPQVSFQWMFVAAQV